MFKIICLLFAVIALSNADKKYTVIVTSGYIIQGINATGVRVKNNNDHQEIMWTENLNDFKIHFVKIYEDTGKVKNYEINSVCSKQVKGSSKDALKRFVLNGFGNTNRCPIKKGTTIKVPLPINFPFQSTDDEDCGPLIIMLNIVKNGQGNSDSPLLFSALYRGTLTC